jgi:hypothetical protein
MPRRPISGWITTTEQAVRFGWTVRHDPQMRRFLRHDLAALRALRAL